MRVVVTIRSTESKSEKVSTGTFRKAKRFAYINAQEDSKDDISNRHKQML